MASAEARLTGQPAVCVATSGPGIANFVNGLADAKNDRVPVIAITGQVDSFNLSTDIHQYVDQGLLLTAAVSYSGQVVTAQAIQNVVSKAMRTAYALGTSTHISITQDVWMQEMDEPVRSAEPYLKTTPFSSEPVIDEFLRQLEQAQRPAILAGRGIQANGLDLLDLAEKWQSGICLTMPAKGKLPGDHPLVLGGLGEGGSDASTRLLAEADLVLIIGATWWPLPFCPKDNRLLQIDIDPLNIGRTMPVDYGVVGDASILIPRITAQLRLTPKPQWMERIHQLKQEWNQKIAPEFTANDSLISPGFLIKAIENTVTEDAVIALDVGDHTVWFNRIFLGTKQEILVSGSWRTMGFAIPAAISAKLAKPERQVVALVGDGGFAQSMAEFLTAVRYRVPITIIVVTNGWLAMEKDKMALEGLDYRAVSLTNPDFVQFATCCGGRGYLASDSRNLENTLRDAFTSALPTIVAVQTTAPLFPGLQAKQDKTT